MQIYNLKLIPALTQLFGWFEHLMPVSATAQERNKSQGKGQQRLLIRRVGATELNEDAYRAQGECLAMELEQEKLASELNQKG